LTPQAGEEFLQSTLAHLDAVHALAWRLVREHAEDLVQETWLKAYGTWTGTPPRDPRAWLVTICLNTARSWYRRDAARPELLASDPAAALAGAADPAADAIGRVRAEAVHKALWTLPEVQRVGVTLMDLSGFTAQEVAGLTGAPQERLTAGHAHAGEAQRPSLLCQLQHARAGQLAARHSWGGLGEAVGAGQVAVVVAVQPQPPGHRGVRNRVGQAGQGVGAHPTRPSLASRDSVCGEVGRASDVAYRFSINVAVAHTVSSTTAPSSWCGASSFRAVASSSSPPACTASDQPMTARSAASSKTGLSGSSPRRLRTCSRVRPLSSATTVCAAVQYRQPASADTRRMTISLVRVGSHDPPRATPMKPSAAGSRSGRCASDAAIGPGTPSAKYGRVGSGAEAASSSRTRAVGAAPNSPVRTASARAADPAPPECRPAPTPARRQPDQQQKRHHPQRLLEHPAVVAEVKRGQETELQQPEQSAEPARQTENEQQPDAELSSGEHPLPEAEVGHEHVVHQRPDPRQSVLGILVGLNIEDKAGVAAVDQIGDVGPDRDRMDLEQLRHAVQQENQAQEAAQQRQTPRKAARRRQRRTGRL